jgi:hypothetical protein
VDSTRLESLVGGVAARQGLVFGEWQRQGSVEAERVLRANTPVRTGFLRDSIVAQLTPSGFTVYPTASYASAVEHGTGPHTIFPSHAKVLCFRIGKLGWAFGEGAIFARRVEHPGFAGRFFIHKSREEIRERLIALYRLIWEKNRNLS